MSLEKQGLISIIVVGLLLGIGDTCVLNAKNMSPGTVFRDCTSCPEMIVLPTGDFRMGSVKGNSRERPVQNIVITKPIAAARYETTFDEWDACYIAGGCSKNALDRNWGRGRRPVMNVLYSDALQYTSWLSRKTGYTYRLPSEAEWEYAARAGTTSEYWWGDNMNKGDANCRKCGTKWSGLQSAPVGSFKPNPWGLYDMHGNVLEYVSDCWSKSHIGLPRDAKPKITKKCQSRVIKSGAWYYLPKVSRSASRARNDTRVFSYFIGFRVFREMD